MELWHVGKRDLDPSFRWGVLIGSDLPAEPFLRRAFAEIARPGEEEALFRRKAVDQAGEVCRVVRAEVRNKRSSDRRRSAMFSPGGEVAVHTLPRDND